MKKLRPRGLKHQYLTSPGGYHASGQLVLDPGQDVSVTILNTFNQGHWSKLTCPQGLLLQDFVVMAQYLLQDQAQKLGFLLGLHTWAYLAQGPQFLLNTYN